MTVPPDFSELNRKQRAALDVLLSQPERKMIELWKSLPAPEIGELHGEYTGLRTLVDVDERTWRNAHETLWNPAGSTGFWLGKGFRPTTATTGEGYNCWSRVGGRIQRFMRFATHIGTSGDGKPSLIMKYAAFKTGVGAVDLTDELRRYEHHIYIGIATRRGRNADRSRPTAFVLAGPGTPWRGVDDEHAET
jgi:hypothetical protein